MTFCPPPQRSPHLSRPFRKKNNVLRALYLNSGTFSIPSLKKTACWFHVRGTFDLSFRLWSVSTMRRAHYKYLWARNTSLILHLIPLKVALSETLFLLSLSCRAARQRHGCAEMLQSNSLCMHYAVVDHAYHCV
ncbi:hypothetical protein KP509_19G022800 [Ceratopteris richardii]|uniref:Uncharacterized protein n=1 Tax=Ceratopteris richardii TaxID=49495 RepID=A0A8T2SMP2_CERRI|nr:hypothetical protein KP509_19G022800 [Ceratopteris richardii]KAH7351969.1 hypothetical protein KP509_19G022800 [Ceratopteris richardii]